MPFSTPDALINTLKTTHDFLTITREHEWQLGQTCKFEVIHQATGETIAVKVIETGLMTFEPVSKMTTKDVVLSSGVHGNETAPIEICDKMIRQLLAGEMALDVRLLFIFGNPASMNIAQRFVEENMNRLFSGGHSQDQGNGPGLINKERERALLLENTVREFFEAGGSADERERFHYDLHTAIRGSKNEKFAVYPFLHGKPRSKEQLQFLKACGVSTVLLSNSPTTTFSYFSSNEFGAHAFTVELGMVKPFGENDMSKFEAVEDTLCRFVSGQAIELGEFDETDHELFEIHQIINRTCEDFTLNFADDVENFTDFPVGAVIAQDGDKEIRIEKQGEAIIFPNAAVAIGQRALLTVIPTKL